MTYQDPVTGDELTRLEYYTRQIQTWVRTPWFLLAFNIITIVTIALGHALEWNDFASWLAVMIEWLVGTYMFGQTGRDATYIRKIAHLEEQNCQLQSINHLQLQHLETLVAEAETRSNQPGNGQDSLHREAPEASERRSS